MRHRRQGFASFAPFWWAATRETIRGSGLDASAALILAMDLGLYLSVPFCRAKCSFCNFASDSHAPTLLPVYMDALLREIATAPERAAALGAELPSPVDSIYFGGGTPSLLSAPDVDRLFQQLHRAFTISPDAEITVECAPGQLGPETLAAMQHHGVNRLSFGVQSFVDGESAAVGRTHTGQACLDEIARVQAAGIADVGVDLIAGLPHQTERSWLESLALTTSAGITHSSVYLLEVDEDSRLGREALAGGPRYGAPALPDEALTVALYETACDHLERAGLLQYEISNFARPGFRSRHNSRYWARLPYLGFGLDAHSMLPTSAGQDVRFGNTDDLPTYIEQGTSPSPGSPTALPLLSASAPPVQRLTPTAVLEETLFLGLRRNEGVRLAVVRESAAAPVFSHLLAEMHLLAEAGLLSLDETAVRLTPAGRLLSNEVFSRLLLTEPAPC